MKALMPSNAADLERMRDELKRVIPQLKITIRSNMKDWRMHAEQLQKLETTLGEQYAELKPFLLRNGEEIGQAMERIQSREQHLNVKFNG